MDGSGEDGKAYPSDDVARDAGSDRARPPNPSPPPGFGASHDPVMAALAAQPEGFGVLETVEPMPGVIDFVWVHANPAMRRLLNHPSLVGLSLIRDHTDGGDEGRGVSGETVGERLGAMVTRARSADGPVGGAVRIHGHRLHATATGFDASSPAGPSRDGLRDHVTVTLREAPTDHRADRLRAALEHASDAIALFDAEGNLVDFTGKLKEMVPEIADMVGPDATFRALLVRLAERAPTIPPEVDLAAWVERRLDRGDGRAAQLAYQSTSGRWLLAKAWRTPDGGIVSVTTDITNFKEQESALRESEAQARLARSEAEKASRAKSDFLAHMSHELRTPLNAIIGFAELMSIRAFGPLGNERYERYAEDVLDSGRHLLELVNDALDLSQIEAGRHKLVEEMVNVCEEVEATARRHQDQALRKGIVVTVDASISLPPLIADRRALRQMLEHLLSNAIKFTGVQGRIQVTATPTPDGGMGIMVADTGIGIEAGDLPRVVQPFGRTEMASRHSVDGTGLGLPIVKRLIEMHGGQLSLESEPGVGTTVILTFPSSRVIDPGALPFALLAGRAGG